MTAFEMVCNGEVLVGTSTDSKEQHFINMFSDNAGEDTAISDVAKFGNLSLDDIAWLPSEEKVKVAAWLTKEIDKHIKNNALRAPTAEESLAYGKKPLVPLKVVYTLRRDGTYK